MTDQLEKKGKDNAQGEKKKAALELADVVRKHNAKYNEMLQQRMAEEDAMRAQLQKEHEKMLADAKKGSSDDLNAALRSQAELQRQLAEGGCYL